MLIAVRKEKGSKWKEPGNILERTSSDTTKNLSMGNSKELLMKEEFQNHVNGLKGEAEKGD